MVRVIVLVSLVLSAAPSFADKASDDFNLGVGFYRTQRWSQAAETFDRFLKEFPEHERRSIARLYFAMSLSSLERYAPAREQFEQYLAAEPESKNSADARYRLGECSYYLKDYSKATEQFTVYLEKHSGHTLADWAKLFLGDSCVNTGNFARAEELLTPLAKGQTSQPIVTEARLSLGKALEGQQKTADAIVQYEAIVAEKDERESPRALNRIAAILYAQQKYPDAAGVYEQLIRDYPGSPLIPSASLGGGMSWYRAGQFEKALAGFQAVPENSPGTAQAIMMTAMCLRELGRVEESRRYFSDALKAAGDTTLAQDILFQQAQMERSVNARDMAARMFEDISDRWPESSRAAECLFNAAELRLELGEREHVERLWSRLKADFPDIAAQPREQILLGRVYLARRESAKAAEVFESVIAASKVPQDRLTLVARYYLIRAYYENSLHDKVVANTELLIESLAPENMNELNSALALAAISSLELKKYDTVLRFADPFLTVSSDETQKADVTAARAVALVHLKKFPDAVASLQTLVTKAPKTAQTWTAVLKSAEAALEQPEPETAATLFQLASTCESDPAIREAGFAGVAWSQFKGKKFPDAAASFALLVRDFPDSADTPQNLFMQARATEEQGDEEKTTAAWQLVFETLTRDKPPAAAGAESMPPEQYAFDAGQQRARGLARLKRLDEADKAWEALVAHFPAAKDLDRVLDEWAWMNSGADRFERSDAIHRQLLEKFPDSRYAGQARLSLAESLLESRQFEPALKEMEAIVADSRYGPSEKERALFHVIEIQAASRNWQPAVAATDQFLQSFSTSPLRPQVQLFAGDGKLQLGDAKGAQTILNDLRGQIVAGTLPVQDWTDRVWIVQAEAALALKSYEEIDALEAELKQRSSESGFLFQMMDIQGRRWKQQAPPDFEKSREYFSKVLTDPLAEGTLTAARCQFLVGMTYLMEKKFDAAEPEFFKVYLNHEHEELRAQGLFRAAVCEAEQKKTDRAIQDFKELVEKFPQSPLVAAANDELRKLGVEPEKPK